MCVALLLAPALAGLRNASEAELSALARAVDVERLRSRGYAVVDNVFAPQELLEIRSSVLGPVLSGRQPLLGGISQCGWGVIPGFVDHPLLRAAHPLIDDPRIHAVLTRVFGSRDSYKHATLTGIGINRPSNWHKDILAGKYAARHQRLPLWPGGNGTDDPDGYLIVKVCIYLQDHTDELGLVVQPGTHQSSRILRAKRRGVRLKHALGSIVVFDQRITHRGPPFGFQPPRRGEHRVMISLSFGRRNGYTDEFGAGTRWRQDAQTAGFTLDSGEGGACPSSQYPTAVRPPARATRLLSRAATPPRPESRS